MTATTTRLTVGVVAVFGVIGGGCLPGVVLEQTPTGPNTAASLCPTNHAVPASVTFDPRLTPDQFIASLKGCTTVTGDFTITRTTLTKLDLPDLKTIGGTLHVEDNTQLTEISLPALESASSVQIVDTTTDGLPLATLDLSALQTGSIEIGRKPPGNGFDSPNGPACDSSADPHALPGIVELDLGAYSGGAQAHVVVLGMGSLTAFNAPQLTSLGGELCFARDGVLDLADGVASLTSVGALIIDQTDIVTFHAPNLAALVGPTPTFSVQNNDVLAALDVSLSPWTTPPNVAVQCDIVVNPTLSQCDAERIAFAIVNGKIGAGPTPKIDGNQVRDEIATTDAELANIADTCISGDLRITGAVTSLAPLSNVVVVLGRLQIAHDDVIGAIAMPSLTQVGKVLDIERTSATSIDLRALRVIGDPFAVSGGAGLADGFSINDNPSLASLNVGGAHFVTQAGVQIFNDPQLSTCDATSVATAMCTSLTCFDAIFGDLATPPCNDIVLSQCGTAGVPPDGPACPQRDSCGDGVIDANEACDDGDRVPFDGCGANCSLETDFQCSGEPSHCTPCGGTTGVSCGATGEGEGEGGFGGEGEGEGGVPACTTFAHDPGTFGLWHLDLPDPTVEASGGVAMTVSAPPPATTTGRFAGGVAVTASNSATVTSAAAPIGSSTLELWLEVNATSAPGTIAAIQYATGAPISLSLGPAGELNATDGAASLSTTAPLSPNAFHRIALRCDTSPTGNFTLFVDGALAAQSAGGIKCARSPADIAQSLTFGNGFTGTLDEIRWSSVARSNTELQTLCH